MTTGLHDGLSEDGTPSEATAPLGVWTGTVTHDDQTDEFTIAFTPDGVVTHFTPVSTGRGSWTRTGDGFRYTLKETFDPGGMPGHVTVDVDARRSGRTYRGSGVATVHAPDGTVLHSTSAEITAAQQSATGRDLLRDRRAVNLPARHPRAGDGPSGASAAKDAGGAPAPHPSAGGAPAEHPHDRTHAPEASVMTAPSRTADAPLAAAKVAVVAGAQAAQADADRRVQPGVIEALDRAGFARWFVPERWGGQPRSYAELTSSVTELGQACSATAWLASLFAFATRYVTCLPEQAQAEVWKDGPDARVAAVVKPLGTAAPADGGWRLSGGWTFVSGVEYADWALLAGPAPSGPPSAGGTPPRFFLVPREDFAYEDTWNALGMRGTGSHTLVLDDVFVPEHRSCLREDAMKGRTVGVEGPPVPTLAVNGLTFVAPALGAAFGALKAAEAAVAIAPTGPRADAGQAYQVAYARAAGEIDAAQFLIGRIAETADSGALTPALIRRSRRDAALALEMLTGAVDGLLRTGGTRAQEDGQPLQRFWRDVRSVASHAVVQFEPAALDWTRGLAS
ncbi:acyl-CoA dehydrogenase family protein [Streptomyces sp. NPDC047108]|uniref:acyl-CoA dehydrogenase family protein n=1 Tax=Streptomyces sp. NPDC047108 TaxID=3155025 RepID=UPI0033F54E5E